MFGHGDEAATGVRSVAAGIHDLVLVAGLFAFDQTSRVELADGNGSGFKHASSVRFSATGVCARLRGGRVTFDPVARHPRASQVAGNAPKSWDVVDLEPQSTGRDHAVVAKLMQHGRTGSMRHARPVRQLVLAQW